jgi:hypothetical protein
LGLVLTAILLLPQAAIAAADDDVDLAEIEAALMLGAEESGGECDQRLKAELEAALRREAPVELAHFEALEQADRLSILELYRDSGYLPAVVSAMGAMPGPVD